MLCLNTYGMFSKEISVKILKGNCKDLFGRITQYFYLATFTGRSAFDLSPLRFYHAYIQS